jgi:hypothetical protein
MFRGSYLKLIVKTMVPNFCHVIPVVNDSVFDWVTDLKDTVFSLSFFPYVNVFTTHVNHDILILAPTDDRGERCKRSVIIRNTGLAHTCSVVDNDWGSLVLLHLRVWIFI